MFNITFLNLFCFTFWFRMVWRFFLNLLLFRSQWINRPHRSQWFMLRRSCLFWNSILHRFLLRTHRSMRAMRYHKFLASISRIINLWFNCTTCRQFLSPMWCSLCLHLLFLYLSFCSYFDYILWMNYLRCLNLIFIVNWCT